MICTIADFMDYWEWSKSPVRELLGWSSHLNVASIQVHLVSRLIVWSQGSSLVVILGHVVFGFDQCSFNPMWGIWPVSRRKGTAWVAVWTWLLYWNSARGSKSSQLSCL